MDGNKELSDFGDRLEKAVIKTIEDGVMTADLARIAVGDNIKTVNTREFFDAIKSNM